MTYQPGSWFSRAFILATAFVLLACDGGPEAQTPDEVRSDLQRATPTPADQAAAVQLAADNAAFGLDLLRQLELDRAPGENLFLSPYSISVAFAMAYAGARGDTATEIADVLRFGLEGDELHAAFNATEEALRRCDDEVCVALANSLWAQRGLPFEPEFLDLLALYHGAGVNLVDFMADPEAARQAVNAWVMEHTGDRIDDLLFPGSVDATTRLVLVNAIYLRAAWARAFERELTADGPFTRRDGTALTVPRMHRTGSYPYVRSGALQAMELPYEGGRLAMVVLLPDAGQLDAVVESLDGSSLAAMLSGLAASQVEVWLPPFEFTSTFDLIPALRALGMTAPFDDADFTGITSENLGIGGVLHQAFVAVDEDGTEAAAATAIIMDASMATPDTGVPVIIPFDVDRPFLFLIRDRTTGAALFLGKVEDPTAGG